MKISIITICFNNEKDIRPTLESVVNQTHKDIEYIVIDGASQDGTLSIIEEYRDDITKLISEPDKGIWDALNKGYRNATGDIVGLIHAGDRLYDNTVVEDIAKHFQKNDIDITYGNEKIVDEHGKVKRINISRKWNLFHLKTGWFPPHQSVYVKNSLIKKLGGYSLERYDGDYEWVIRYFTHKGVKIKKLDRYIIWFSLGGTSTSQSHYKNYFDKAHRDGVKRSWRKNGIKPPLGIFYFKILRKIPQFIRAFFHK